MNKQKYIHIKRKPSRNNYKGNSGRKPKHRPMCIDDYEKLPTNTSIKFRNYEKWHEYHSTTYVDFYSNIRHYLEENIGHTWDDIYSDLISKTKPRYRHILEQDIDWIFIDVCYYINDVPYSKVYYRNSGLIINDFYLDKERKVRYFETKEELLIYARNIHREKKLERILDYEEIDVIEFDDVIESDDILTNNCDEIRLNSRIQWFYNRYSKS